jgi:hypothetical protein
MTERQKEVVEFLENLVGKRFNLSTLNEVLSEQFDEVIKCEIVNDDDEENTLTDWDIMFDSVKEETYGYFDIYVLKMRKPGFDGSTFHITEIGYEFE